MPDRPLIQLIMDVVAFFLQNARFKYLHAKSDMSRGYIDGDSGILMTRKLLE